MKLTRPISFAATAVSSSSATVSPRSNPIANRLPWRHLTVEWSPKVVKLYENQPEIFQTTTHWVFPDLPQVLTPDHRKSYWQSTPPHQRIQTLAACRHESYKSLVETAKHRLEWTQDDGGKGKLLLVGGNDKTADTISTIQAARILRSELGETAELWGVADPNDPESVEKVMAKTEAGITGFLTQPLLTSIAWETLPLYHSVSGISVVAGMALPRTAQNLQFWRQLLDRPQLLDKDPLFQSHLAYFSQPYTTSMAWIGRELQQFVPSGAGEDNDGTTCNAMGIDGIHLMPLQNTRDLAAILQTLSR